MCRVVSCFRGDKPPLRKAGPPEQPQHDLRRQHSLHRTPAVHEKTSGPRQTQFFVAMHLQRHASNHHIATSLRTSTAVLPSPLLMWGFMAESAHPTDPKSDRRFAGPGRKHQPAAASLRGGRARAVASLVGCPRVFVDHLAFFVF